MSDSEDDYMSDKLLLGCEKDDIRPGLLFNKTQKRNHEIYKQKQEVKKPKRYHEEEKEVREKGLSTAIPEDNKGFKLLQKMGYKTGEGLGKAYSGITKPIGIKLKNDNTGLGTESRIKEIVQARHSMKKQMSKACEEEYQKAIIAKRTNLSLIKDYFKAQRICEDLDFKNENKSPEKPFFWSKQTMAAVKKKTELNDDSDEESEEEEEEEEEQPSEAALNEIIHYIRNVYGYCMYCCDYVDDVKDPPAVCPGFYRTDHDDE